jgi:hypothetical protein
MGSNEKGGRKTIDRSYPSTIIKNTIIYLINIYKHELEKKERRRIWRYQ